MATKTKSKRKPKATLKELNVNFNNKENIYEFIQDNIAQINNNIGSFDNNACKKAKLKFDATDIKKALHNRFLQQIESDASFRGELWREFETHNFAKSKIKEIAIHKGLFHKDIEGLFSRDIFTEISAEDTEELSKDFVANLLSSKGYAENRIRYYKSVITPIVEKSLYLALRNGFSINLSDIDSGLMIANAGDSAQFLFLARAILAGYNCSNVDVRSSRYDAVVDKNGKLFRVQIKGISGDEVSIKDRDRGGRGIDSKNNHNKGKRITSKDCDIYVAVDRQTGICYIIPISHIEKWEKETKKIKTLVEYKENWKAIDELG